MSKIEKKSKPEQNSTHEGQARAMAITLKAVVIGKKGQVLVLKRSPSEMTNKGKWDLPGGHLEKNQTIEESLRREVAEETGLEIDVGPIIRVVEFDKDHPAFNAEKRGLRFIAWAKTDDVRLSDEHEQFEWLSMQDAVDLFSAKDGFEKEKKETLTVAMEHLQMMQSFEGWKRAVADLENYKKRCSKDNQEFRKFCLEDFILAMLPVLDNFEMASKHMPKSEDNSWAEGILHIKKQLLDVLKSQGVEKIKVAKGDHVDPAKHEVISTQGNDAEGDTVKKVLKSGYTMHGKVIRPATVETK